MGSTKNTQLLGSTVMGKARLLYVHFPCAYVATETCIACISVEQKTFGRNVLMPVMLPCVIPTDHWIYDRHYDSCAAYNNGFIYVYSGHTLTTHQCNSSAALPSPNSRPVAFVGKSHLLVFDRHMQSLWIADIATLYEEGARINKIKCTDHILHVSIDEHYVWTVSDGPVFVVNIYGRHKESFTALFRPVSSLKLRSIDYPAVCGLECDVLMDNTAYLLYGMECTELVQLVYHGDLKQGEIIHCVIPRPFTASCHKMAQLYTNAIVVNGIVYTRFSGRSWYTQDHKSVHRPVMTIMNREHIIVWMEHEEACSKDMAVNSVVYLEIDID